jgi:Fur family zinc uptake transcriptional regulator
MTHADRAPNHERVLSILKKATAPMTAYEVLDAARKHNISAPPTVYRALNRLIGEGRAHRLDTINAYVACADAHHGHGNAVFAICNGCGQVEEIHEDGSLKKLLAKADAHGFTVDQAVIELKGHCGTCTEPQAK